MNVLMLNYEFPPLGGGAANANRYLLDEFSRADELQIDLITSSPDGFRKREFSENVTIYEEDVGKKAIHHWRQREIARYSWKAYRRAKALGRRREYDLVHAWFSVPSGVVAARFDLPYLVALRGSDVPGYNERFALQYTVLEPVIRRVWSKADAVVANSKGLRSLALETANVPIDVIPNGVDVDQFVPSYGVDGTPTVLCVSRLIERKGISYLIRAVAETDAELVLVGEGENQPALERLVADLGIEGRVTFAGYVPHDEIDRYYSEADVFVLPSMNEGMSNAVLEAMAAGLPIITTDTGGTEELVDDNGFVVPRRDAESIRECIQTYIRDPSVMTRHGRASRAKAEDMSWEAVAQQYVEKYEEIT